MKVLNAIPYLFRLDWDENHPREKKMDLKIERVKTLDLEVKL